MSIPTTTRVVRLRRRPEGWLREGDLEFLDEPMPDLVEGQALVRTLVLSVDPTSRIWMGHARSFMPPVPLGAVMRGLGVGEVSPPAVPTCRWATSWSGSWAGRYCLADDNLLEAPSRRPALTIPAPASTFLGVLGHTAGSPPTSAWSSSTLSPARPSSSRPPPGPWARSPASSLEMRASIDQPDGVTADARRPLVRPRMLELRMEHEKSLTWHRASAAA